MFLIVLDRYYIKVLDYVSALVTCPIVPYKRSTRPTFGLFACGHPTPGVHTISFFNIFVIS